MSNSSLESAISALSPKLWYKCTETTGTTITNYGSATGCNLTLAGSYTLNDRELITGDAQKFLHLNSGTSTTGGRAVSSGIGNLATPITGDWTISFLLEFVSTMNTSTDYWVFSHGSSGESTATNHQFASIFTTPNAIPSSFWEFGTGGTNVTSTFTKVLNGGLLGGYDAFSATSTNKFIVTIVKDSVEMLLNYYVNGFFKETISYSAEPTGGTSNSIRIGATSGSEAVTNSTVGHIFYVDSKLAYSDILNLAYEAGYVTSTSISVAIDASIDPTIFNADLVDSGYSL